MPDSAHEPDQQGLSRTASAVQFQTILQSGTSFVLIIAYCVMPATVGLTLIIQNSPNGRSPEGANMPRAAKPVPDSMLASALWVLALALAALVGSPYVLDNREEFPHAGMSTESRMRR